MKIKSYEGQIRDIRYKLLLETDAVSFTGIRAERNPNNAELHLTYLLDEAQEAEIILSLGPSFSPSKRWQSVWQQAKNFSSQDQRNLDLARGKVWR